MNRVSGPQGSGRPGDLAGDGAVELESIRATAQIAGLEICPSATTDLAAFAGLFLHWNAKINLGGDISGEGLVRQHYLDAFAVARVIAPGDSVIDVGSGGGLPVVPLAIVREQSRFEGYEPTGKKVAFLRTAVRELRLGGRLAINAARLGEPLVPGMVGRFDVAISRATFAPQRWLELGRGLVRPGGLVVVFGTATHPEGCPLPDETRDYGPNRRLLLFRV